MLGKRFFPDSHLVCHPSIICELSQVDSVNCDLCLKLSNVENEIKPRFVNKYLFFNNSSNNKSNKKSLPLKDSGSKSGKVALSIIPQGMGDES